MTKVPKIKTELLQKHVTLLGKIYHIWTNKRLSNRNTYLPVTTQLQKPPINGQWDFLPAGKAVVKRSWPPVPRLRKNGALLLLPCLHVFDKVSVYFTLIRRMECEATRLGKRARFIGNCNHQLQKHHFSLNTEAEDSSETLVSIYKTTRCHYPEYVILI